MRTFASRTEQANYHHLVMDIAWFGLAMASTTRFMQFYALRMGASPMDLGWLTALPAALLVFATALSHWWRNRYSDSAHAVWLPSIGFRFVFLLPAFAPFFPEDMRITWIIIAATLPALAQGISSTIFMVLMRESITPEQLTPLFTRRALAMNITITLGAIVFGLLLELLPFPTNYQVMFLLAFGFAMVSQWHVGRINVIVPKTTAKSKLTWQSFSRLLRDSRFQSVIFVTLLSHVAYFSVFAVVPLRLERDLGATEGFMAAFGIVELMAGAFMTMFLSRMVQRLGNRAVVALAMVGTATGSLVIAMAPSMWVALIGAALTGASWTAVGIGVLGFFAEKTESGDISAVILFHQVIFVSMFIGPLMGSSMANAGVSIVLVLLGGTVLRLVGGALIQIGLVRLRGGSNSDSNSTVTQVQR